MLADMTSIDIVVFCYRGEEELLPMSLGRLRGELPFARIHLFDDAKDPLREHVVKQLQELTGCTYEKTTFDRNKNLNGKECIVGELECMMKVMRENNNQTGYVIKMDPDTVVLRANLVLEAMNNGAKWISHNSMKGHFAGMFYVIHWDILQKVYDNAKVMQFPDNCAEDETIGALCYIAAAQGVYSWTDISTQANAKKFAALPVQFMESPQWINQVAYVAQEGHIVTVGNCALYGMPKSYQTKAMKDLLNVFYNYDELSYANKWPDLRDNIECGSLECINIQKNKLRGQNLATGDPILTGVIKEVNKFTPPETQEAKQEPPKTTFIPGTDIDK